MEDRVGGGDAVRRRLERQVTVDWRLESRVGAYGTLLTGARGGTSPGCIVPRLAGQSGRLQCLAHMGMYSIINISTKKSSVVARSLAGRASTVTFGTTHTGRAREAQARDSGSPGCVLLPSFH